MIVKCIYCKLITGISVVNICHNTLLSEKFSFGKSFYRLLSWRSSNVQSRTVSCDPATLHVTCP